mmetsp:Transcript_107372/g.269307  ORF Transcript_107372/g.269307 Transcript_107372/m.269307 type:complete len:207 (+) Transcript_107372:106-726(+)
MTAFTSERVSSWASISWISARPASGSPLLVTASTMQPKVMQVGVIRRDFISCHITHTPSRSFRKPYARIKLPYVCAALTCTPLALRCRSRWRARRSERLVRMQASQIELSNTSSIATSTLSTILRARSMSLGCDLCWTLFSKMEQVMLFGLRPHASISSTTSHMAAPPFAAAASISSLKVTELGAKPEDRIVCTNARARPTSPSRK